PGLSKAYRPSTAAPLSSGGLLAVCLTPTSLSSGRGIGTRAIDSRPVSCRAQPSVVSLQRRRDMLRVNNAYTLTLEAESSAEPARKSEAIGHRVNIKPCRIRDHNHTNPEYVWGDEGPVNEREETS